MKKTAVCPALISSFLLFSTTLLHSAERKIVFNTESMKYESATGSERCRDKCGRRSGPDAKSLVSEGWRVVSSSPKEVIAEQYYYVPCNTCKPHGCICIGTEYILQKEEPAPKFETTRDEFDAPEKDKRKGLHPPKYETSINEFDLLKKENELLKQENASLKQEIERLKNEIRSIQK